MFGLDGQSFDDPLSSAEQFFGIGRFDRGYFHAPLQLGVEGGTALDIPLRAHDEKRILAGGDTDTVRLRSNSPFRPHVWITANPSLRSCPAVV